MRRPPTYGGYPMSQAMPQAMPYRPFSANKVPPYYPANLIWIPININTLDTRDINIFDNISVQNCLNNSYFFNKSKKTARNPIF